MVGAGPTLTGSVGQHGPALLHDLRGVPALPGWLGHGLLLDPPRARVARSEEAASRRQRASPLV